MALLRPRGDNKATRDAQCHSYSDDAIEEIFFFCFFFLKIKSLKKKKKKKKKKKLTHQSKQHRIRLQQNLASHLLHQTTKVIEKIKMRFCVYQTRNVVSGNAGCMAGTLLRQYWTERGGGADSRGGARWWAGRGFRKGWTVEGGGVHNRKDWKEGGGLYEGLDRGGGSGRMR